MKEYHKINTVWKRDDRGKLIEGDYAHEAFAYLAGCRWTFTEKVDGTNIRVIVNKDGPIEFRGKTDNASIPASLVGRLQARFLSGFEEARLREIFPEGGCLYGEGYGAKIQKGGGLYRPDQDFVLFDVRVGHWWLQRKDVEGIGGTLGVLTVPIRADGTLDEACSMACQGFSSAWGPFPAEGLVMRPFYELADRAGNRIIAKIKTRDYQ